MQRPSPFLVLATAWIAVSFAGPLVKLSASHPITIAFWRLLFTCIVVSSLVMYTKQWRQWRYLGYKRIALACGAGVLLACDYSAWNMSVQMGTIASSATLSSMAPVFVAVLSSVFLREPPTRAQILGMTIAIIGATVIALANLAQKSGNAFYGSLFALASAVFASGYYITGRYLRNNLGIWAYVTPVYVSCLVTLFVMALMNEVQLVPESGREYSIFAALALGPMLIGTTGKNWTLKYFPAHVVSLVAVAEPVGATLLGIVLPGIKEVPSGLVMIGGAVTLMGVVIAQFSKPASKEQIPA